MTSSRFGRRAAGAAAALVLAGAGALASASPAAAKGYDLAFESGSLSGQNALAAKVAYSCDEHNDYALVVNATKLNVTGHDEANASGLIKADKLTCDYTLHTATLNLRTQAGSRFEQGDQVKFTVFYFDSDGFSFFKQDKVVTL
ncbi:hypothetical protein [Streptomyces griseocarneus]|uniref:hypothetical protein n=1 Tax=Streptomyces griseocarneus TaxID=51201 RepID=UPI00167E1171|nr:hypothetical protein [Streptomyces griseocarneus]MBZ6473696.1 hypothetical protein [Streptomyces griseocarneus]